MSESELHIPNLTDEQIDLITARRLDSLKGERWIPYDIYRGIAKLTVRPTVEVAFVKSSEEDEADMQILLTQRPREEENIGSQWHIPGSGMGPTDPVRFYNDNDAAVGRVYEEVGGDLQSIERPFLLHEGVKRAGYGETEITAQYWVPIVAGSQEHGEFFHVAGGKLIIPPKEGLVIMHDITIAEVSEAFAEYQNK